MDPLKRLTLFTIFILLLSSVIPESRAGTQLQIDGMVGAQYKKVDGSTASGISAKFHPMFFFGFSDFELGAGAFLDMRASGFTQYMLSGAARFFVGNSSYLELDLGYYNSPITGSQLAIMAFLGYKVTKKIILSYGFLYPLTTKSLEHNPYIGLEFSL